MKKPRARCTGGVGIDGDGGGVGGILNLGGSIDFTIWTPPKVKNKPSRTYSTLIECLSSARLVSTHRPPKREKKRETRGTEQSRRRRRRRRWAGGRGQGTRKREPARGRNRVEARAGGAEEGGNKEEEGKPTGEGRRGEKRVAKCRSSTSTPVRNKEQKIDRLLSFMFLRGRRRGSSVRPSPLSLSRPFSFNYCISFPLTFYFSIPVFRTVDVFFSFSLSLSSSLFLVATYNKTN